MAAKGLCILLLVFGASTKAHKLDGSGGSHEHPHHSQPPPGSDVHSLHPKYRTSTTTTERSYVIVGPGGIPPKDLTRQERSAQLANFHPLIRGVPVEFGLGDTRKYHDLEVIKPAGLKREYQKVGPGGIRKQRSASPGRIIGQGGIRHPERPHYQPEGNGEAHRDYQIVGPGGIRKHYDSEEDGRGAFVGGVY